MCPIFNGCGDTALGSLKLALTDFRFLSVGMDEERSLQIKIKHKRRIGRSHYE